MEKMVPPSSSTAVVIIFPEYLSIVFCFSRFDFTEFRFVEHQAGLRYSDAGFALEISPLKGTATDSDPVTEFYWVLLGFTGFYWVYWVLLGFTGFYWVLLAFKL